MLLDKAAFKLICNKLADILKHVLIIVTFVPELVYIMSQDEIVVGKYIWLFVVPEERLNIK